MAKDKDDAEKVEMYRNGKMTRAGMEKVIGNGGAVMHQGTVYTKVDDLPDDATLTEGDEAGARQAQASIDAQIAALASQRAALDDTAARARAKPTPAPEPAKPKEEPAKK